MGRVQLARTEEMLARRLELDRMYRAALADIPGTRITPDSRHESSYHLFTLEIGPEARCSRDEFVEGMYARGIGVSLHFIPLYRHTYYRKTYGLSRRDYPHSEEIYKSIVSLPLYSAMSRKDGKKVISAIREILG